MRAGTSTRPLPSSASQMQVMTRTCTRGSMGSSLPASGETDDRRLVVRSFDSSVGLVFDWFCCCPTSAGMTPVATVRGRDGLLIVGERQERAVSGRGGQDMGRSVDGGVD